jgi:phosphate transport system protein
MQRHLDEELRALNTSLLKMAAMTEEAIHSAVEALRLQDKDLADRIIDDDKKIDEMEITNEEKVIDLLALFQPMAGDLRFITTGMHINAELERIADLTVNICQRAKEMAGQPFLKPLEDIPRLAAQAQGMVKGAIDAFVRRDEKLAQDVILSDKHSNAIRSAIIRELIQDFLIPDGRTAPRAIPLLLVARDLERICDHAAAIAEDVIYMIRAKVVKHHPERLTPGS